MIAILSSWLPNLFATCRSRSWLLCKYLSETRTSECLSKSLNSTIFAPFSASILPYWCLNPWIKRNPFGSSALCLIRANTRPRLRQFHKFPFGVGKTNWGAFSWRTWFSSRVIAPCDRGSIWSLPALVARNKISDRSKSISPHSSFVWFYLSERLEVSINQGNPRSPICTDRN